MEQRGTNTMKKSVFEKVESAKNEKAKRIKEIEGKIEEAKKTRTAEEAKMEEAMLSGDIPAYSVAKAKASEMKDAEEVFSGLLSSVKSGSLFGDKTKAVIKEMRAELGTLEDSVLEKIKPMIEQALSEVSRAQAEYEVRAFDVAELYKDSGKTASAPIAWKLSNVKAELEKLQGQVNN